MHLRCAAHPTWSVGMSLPTGSAVPAPACLAHGLTHAAAQGLLRILVQAEDLLRDLARRLLCLHLHDLRMTLLMPCAGPAAHPGPGEGPPAGPGGAPGAAAAGRARAVGPPLPHAHKGAPV